MSMSKTLTTKPFPMVGLEGFEFGGLGAGQNCLMQGPQMPGEQSQSPKAMDVVGDWSCLHLIVEGEGPQQMVTSSKSWPEVYGERYKESLRYTQAAEAELRAQRLKELLAKAYERNYKTLSLAVLEAEANEAATRAIGWGASEPHEFLSGVVGKGRLKRIIELGRRLVSSKKANAAESEALWSKWTTRIERFRDVGESWDGGGAAPPNAQAVSNSQYFLACLWVRRFEPSQIGASIVGGVGFTFRKGSRKVYVEFNNRGNALVLFSDGATDPIAQRIEPQVAEYHVLIQRAKAYLDE